MAGRSWRIHLCLAATAALFVSTLGVSVTTTSRAHAATQPAAAQPRATYVGQDTCLTCHSDLARGYVDSAHGHAANPRTPAARQGCESCHGPGGAHVEDPIAHPMFRFAQVPPDQASDQCLACHRRGDHALWDSSQHASRNLSCITCHSVHDAQSDLDLPTRPRSEPTMIRTSRALAAGVSDAQLTAPSELELCGRCHRDKVVKLDRSGHMPVREGKMQCSSCHNPHGSVNERMLTTGNTSAEACSSCHADKRGPFLWEHAPVTENCALCHDPHGSANERMLIAKLPMLCQRCHIHTRHPSTIYDAAVLRTSNRLYARSCVTCHSNIHGSNHASGNVFLR